MKKIVVLAVMLLIATFSIYSMDAEKMKNALSEGEYIPALVDYGFTERQIKKWRATNALLSRYFQPKRHYENPQHLFFAINAYGEVSKKDMVRVEQFLNDAYAFWTNEQQQKANAVQQQKQQEREQYEQSLTQYAKTFGLVDFVEGIMQTIMDITPKNFEMAKKVLIVPMSNLDKLYSVQNIVNGYVIYSAVLSGTVHQVALKAEQGKPYLANNPLDLDSVYKIEGTMRLFAGSADTIVISRLGPRR